MVSDHISIVGAGRVGAAISRELYNCGFIIDKVVSRTEVNGKTVASACKAVWSEDPLFPPTTGIIIVAVTDGNLKTVLDSIQCNPDTVVAHTAGSYGLDLFPEKITRKGVFYPLQTFSTGRALNFKEIPLFIEASDNETLRILNDLAESVSLKIYHAGADSRKLLHLAAVFASNFTNHILTESMQIASRAGFRFEILEPLVKETVAKAISAGPEVSQTGPAFRNDTVTIEKHKDLLSYSPDLQEIYMRMTELIINYYKNSSSGQF